MYIIYVRSEFSEGDREERCDARQAVDGLFPVKEDFNGAVECLIFEKSLTAGTARGDRVGLEALLRRGGVVVMESGPCGDSYLLHRDTRETSRRIIGGGPFGAHGRGVSRVLLVGSGDNLTIIHQDSGTDVEFGVGGQRTLRGPLCGIYKGTVLLIEFVILQDIDYGFDLKLFHIIGNGKKVKKVAHDGEEKRGRK